MSQPRQRRGSEPIWRIVGSGQLGAAALVTLALMMGFERPHAVWTFPAVASVAWNVIAVSIGAMGLH